MRTKPIKKQKKNMVKDLVIDEVSFCIQGMNGEADILLHKSADQKLIKELFNEVLADMQLGEKVEELMEMIYEQVHALRRSVWTIMNDEEVKDKKKAIKSNLSAYVDSLAGIADDKKLLKSFDVSEWAGQNPDASQEDALQYITTTFAKEDQSMKPEEIKKMQDALKKAEETTAALAAKVEKSEKINALSTDHRTHYDGLGTEELRDEFLGKSVEERTALLKALNVQEEVLVISGGGQIKKSEVGEGTFYALKAQQQEIEAGKVALAKAEEARLAKEFEALAESTYPNLSGTPVEKGIMLRKINEIEDEGVRKAALESLKTANGLMVKVFDQNGHQLKEAANTTGVEKSDALAKLTKMAEDRAAETKVSFAKAYDEVLKTEEGDRLYNLTVE